MMYADIIVDISHEKLDRSFQYRVPEALISQVQVGMVASIPFGNGNHLRKGYIIGLSETPAYASDKIKEIAGLCSDEAATESRLIALAWWMKEHYGSTMIQALKTVLPIQEKVKGKEKRTLRLMISHQEAETLLHELQGSRCKARARVLETLLQQGQGFLDYTKAVKEAGLTPSVLRYFEEREIIHLEYEQVYRMPVDTASIPREEEKPLSCLQQTAVDEI